MSREDGIHEIEVHVAGLCFAEQNGEMRCLVGKRSSARHLYPDLWECGGGQVAKGESFVDAVRRQMKEEFGIDVEVLYPFSTYTIKTEDKVIPGIKFVCLLKNNQPIQIDHKELVDHAWVTQSEASSYAMIEGIPLDIKTGLALYQKLGATPLP